MMPLDRRDELPAGIAALRATIPIGASPDDHIGGSRRAGMACVVQR